MIIISLMKLHYFEWLNELLINDVVLGLQILNPASDPLRSKILWKRVARDIFIKDYCTRQTKLCSSGR